MIDPNTPTNMVVIVCGLFRSSPLPFHQKLHSRSYSSFVISAIMSS